MLTRSVDAGKRLLVKQAFHAVLVGDSLQGQHHQLLMVGGDVGVLIDGGDFVLRGSNFVVTSLHRNAELIELSFDLEHAGEDALGDGTEVLIFELLALGGLRAKEGSAGVEKVRPGEEEVAVDEEVFLLGTGGRGDHADILVSEKLEDSLRLLVEGLHRAEQRCLLVESFASPRDERRRDAEGGSVGVFENVSGAGDVPGGVATSFEGGADAARGEARSVRFTLNEGFAGEFHDGAAGSIGREEAVVLLGGEPGEWMEDVSVVGGTLGDSPILHGGGDDVGSGGIELRAGFDRRFQRLENFFGKPILHYRQTENVRAEHIGGRSVGEIQRGGGGTVVGDGGDGLET